MHSSLAAMQQGECQISFITADLQFLGFLTPATAAAEGVHHPVRNWSPSYVVLVPYLGSQASSINCIACMQLQYTRAGRTVECAMHTMHAKQQTAKQDMSQRRQGSRLKCKQLAVASEHWLCTGQMYVAVTTVSLARSV